MDPKSSDIAGWNESFLTKVFPSELATILARRWEVARRKNPDEPKPEPRTPERPSVRLGLVGLAFSGGGIRSATFNLGIVQALAKQGLLARVDYLSTVSGGGYIGSCLSALLNRPETDSNWSPAFPFYMESGRQEPPALAHLRNHSRYLLSAATRGYVGMVAVLLRGIFVNLLALLPFVIALVGVTHLIYGEELDSGPPLLAVTGVMLALFCAATVLFPLADQVGKHLHVEQRARQRATDVYLAMFLGVVIAALVESLPLALKWYHLTDGMVLQGATSISVILTVLSQVSGWLDKIKGTLLLAGVAVSGPLVVLMVYLQLGEWVLFPDTSPLGDRLATWLAIYCSGAAILIYVAIFLDANATSNHRFYRDRLSQAYLFQIDAESRRSQPVDGLRLSELNAEGTVAPLHIINAAVNLQGSKKERRDRQSDFFIFSKHFIGSTRTGYCPTSTMEQADPHLSLGTAMAISAAAASPAMGAMTMRSLALVMTMLNARLGYWLMHPERAASNQVGLLWRVGVGLSQLTMEALSRASDDGRHVNVSDGGHIENLGVYELLRRRCRLIICGDGEADPHMAFHGLATLIRYAATDMGIHIDINLERLALDAERRSEQHYAVGRIDYGDGEEGVLLYMKLSIGKNELPYIENYRRANPDFPHQSTADQFFDEAQFEAYRALGFKVGMRTLEALKHQESFVGDGPLSFGIHRSMKPASEDVPDWTSHARPAADPERPW